MKHDRKFFLNHNHIFEIRAIIFLHTCIVMNIFKQPFLTTYGIKYDKIHNRVYSLNLCCIVKNTVHSPNCN